MWSLSYPVIFHISSVFQLHHLLFKGKLTGVWLNVRPGAWFALSVQTDFWFLSSVLRFKKSKMMQKRNRSKAGSDPRTTWVWRDLKCMSESLPDHRLFPPSAPSSRPQKHGWDVKLPGISCDNKQLLSFEISLYSWTALIFFSPSPARRQSRAGSGLAPTAPLLHPPLLLWCAGSQGGSVAKLLFLQLWELDPLIVGGQVSSCPHDRTVVGRVRERHWRN